MLMNCLKRPFCPSKQTLKLTIFRGNKGALSVPLLSFQFLRRPDCAAKLSSKLIVSIPFAPLSKLLIPRNLPKTMGAIRAL
jgi:hypothetical protein